jgi:glycerophosphoryl diester phosphodiesterase
MSWLTSAVLTFAIAQIAGSTPPSPQPMVIAHRGASGLAPEHTIAAYDLALELGADVIEQDLQVTRDGVLIVLHDEKLDRTARGPVENCTGPVQGRSLSELETCEFGTWFEDRVPGSGAQFADQKILTLEAVFERYRGRATFYIETKNPEQAPGVEQALLSLLATHKLLPGEGRVSRVILQSFSAESLRSLRSLQPDLPLVQLVGRRLGRPLDEALREIAEYANGVGPPRSQVDAAFIVAARKHGLFVHPYTANEPEEMSRLLDLGVDGLFTDRPDRLIEILREE